MKLIFAQGNPGKQYETTRHNVGFLALDYYAQQKSLNFQSKMKFNADIAETTIDGEKILLVKPMTFYNETGVSARALLDFYKLSSNDTLVLHDELALEFGTLRTREKGSDAGNNGIKSLNTHIGQEYARVRIGIRNDFASRMDPADFVLAKFSSSEREKLESDIFSHVARIIDQFIKNTHENTSISL